MELEGDEVDPERGKEGEGRREGEGDERVMGKEREVRWSGCRPRAGKTSSGESSWRSTQ